MKILIVNDQFENGGAGRVAATMCNELVKRGYEIHVATDNTHFSIKYELCNSIHLHSIDFSTHGSGNLNRVFALIRTSKEIQPIIKLINPNVIIAIQANGFIRTLLANRGTKLPLIAADHTSFERKMDFINTLTRHYLYKYADGISILTNRDKNLLGPKYPQKRVIYNPLTYDLLTEDCQRRKTILCAGRFDIWRIKGFDYMVQIWSKLAPRFPEWTLEFAGTGKEENVNYIKGLVSENHLEDRVRFIGQVSDMQKLYGQSGIFALSSRIEGFPMVLLEAMSQGCPCVAFNVGGASEEMIEKGCGYVINDGNIQGFEDALAYLIANNEKRNEFSRKAVQSVEKFSLEKFIRSWEQLINESILKKK